MGPNWNKGTSKLGRVWGFTVSRNVKLRVCGADSSVSATPILGGKPRAFDREDPPSVLSAKFENKSSWEFRIGSIIPFAWIPLACFPILSVTSCRWAIYEPWMVYEESKFSQNSSRVDRQSRYWLITWEIELHARGTNIMSSELQHLNATTTP